MHIVAQRVVQAGQKLRAILGSRTEVAAPRSRQAPRQRDQLGPHVLAQPALVELAALEGHVDYRRIAAVHRPQGHRDRLHVGIHVAHGGAAAPAGILGLGFQQALLVALPVRGRFHLDAVQQVLALLRATGRDVGAPDGRAGDGVGASDVAGVAAALAAARDLDVDHVQPFADGDGHRAAQLLRQLPHAGTGTLPQLEGLEQRITEREHRRAQPVLARILVLREVAHGLQGVRQA